MKSLSLPFSGPPTCLCSRVEECLAYGDNELELVPNIAEVRIVTVRLKPSILSVQEIICRDLCAANSDCAFYTWYDGTLALGNFCVLLSSCEERDSSCSSCHTAPVPCSHQMESTSTAASTTTTTTTSTPASTSTTTSPTTAGTY